MFVRKQGGDAFDRVVAALGPELREPFASGPLETEWYPYIYLIELSTVIDRVLGVGDLAMCETMGSFSCEHNLTGIYRIFFRFGNINFLFDRAAKAWRSQYDFGTMVLHRESKQRVRLELSDLPQLHRQLYLAVKGWGIKAAALSGSEITMFEDAFDPTPGHGSSWIFEYL
jgi:hypothetical protein